VDSRSIQRVVVVDEGLLSLTTRDSAERWKNILLDVGLMLEVPESDTLEPGNEGWSPHQCIREVQHHLHETYQTEQAITSVRATGPFRAGVVPAHIWIGMLVAMALMIEFSNLLLAVAGGALLFGACGWLGLGAVARYDQHERQKLNGLRQHRNGHALAMRRATEMLVGHSFVAVIGRSRIESCPHLIWLSAKNRQLYQLGHEPLRKQVTDVLNVLEARLEELRNAAPMQGWTQDGLQPDLHQLVQACREAGVPTNPPDDVIWDALRQAGLINP
jgi:hypothetical protein